MNTLAPAPPVLVPPRTACELLGISRSTLIRWEAEGKIRPPRRLHGGHRRYLLADLRAVLSESQA